jgi:hypothetical protein
LEEKTRERAWRDLAGAGAGCPQREGGMARIIRIPRRRLLINSSFRQKLRSQDQE